MELSINIGGMRLKYGLEKAAELVSHAGFTACDYGMGDLEKPETRLYSEEYRDEARLIRQTVESYGLKITQTHAPFHFSAKQWDTPEKFDEIVIPRLAKAIEINSILGSKIMVVHPIHHMEYHGHEEEIFQRNMDFYRRLIPYCKEFDVKVAVENMWQHDKRRGCKSFDTCNTISEFIRYVDTLDSEYIIACLDVGHVVLPDTKEEPWDFIRALGHERLKSIHIHDNDYTKDAHWLPYMGIINWSEITRALGEINYDGDFTYEVNDAFYGNIPERILQQSVDFMGMIGRELVTQVEENRIIK